MLSRFAAAFSNLAQRVVPDPFVIALGLTALAFVLGLAVMEAPDATLLARGWFARVTASGTLAFTAQMSLILVAGATLARAPAVHRVLSGLADVPKTTRSAAALTALVAMLAALVNWGFGLVAGAVLARAIGERAREAGRRLDYALVGAAGYSGMLVWHGGLSGSAPLKAAEGGPAGGPAVPLDATLFSSLNLLTTLALLIVVPWVLAAMASPDRERGADALPEALGDTWLATDSDGERHPALGAVLGVFIVGLAIFALGTQESSGTGMAGLGLGSVILGLVIVGLALFATPQRYGRAFSQSASEAGGILLQFPFYFGILGLLEASGLVGLLAESSAGMARGLSSLGPSLGWSFDVVTFLSAGLVNLFVPSGGGQWAVQGAIVEQASGDLGLPFARSVMALSYGDAWTNMLQPFWALALLGITGLKAREILGYTLVIMLASGLVFAALFALV